MSQNQERAQRILSYPGGSWSRLSSAVVGLVQPVVGVLLAFTSVTMAFRMAGGRAFHNRVRRHSTPEHMTPDEFERTKNPDTRELAGHFPRGISER